MQPLQIMMAEGHCSILSEVMQKTIDVDIFSAAYSLSMLSAELIVKMEERGLTDEAGAIKKDWINMITNPSELIRLDNLPKTAKGKWKA